MHGRTRGGNLYPRGCTAARVLCSRRSKDRFTSGGVNVHPARIEAELLVCPVVRDAAVHRRARLQAGRVGVPLVKPAISTNRSTEEVTSFLAERLAKHKLPPDLLFVAALPRTALGQNRQGKAEGSVRALDPKRAPRDLRESGGRNRNARRGKTGWDLPLFASRVRSTLRGIKE
jgi:hypothetical protein